MARIAGSIPAGPIFMKMTNIDDFKQAYSGFQEKYSLPDISAIDDEFEIFDFIAERRGTVSFPLRYLRRHMVSVLYNWINYLHNFIMPNPQSAILIRESEYFTEEQKNEVITLIKEIMYANRLSAKLDLVLSEKEDAAFINDIFRKWPKLKSKLQEFADINVNSWKKDMPKNKESYFG